MARQDVNDIFAQTSFLYGGNAAYLEELYARYQQNPSSVDEQWQTFFAGLKHEGSTIVENARGASWKRPNWPIVANGELVSALDGNWVGVEKAIGDKIKGKAQAKGVELSQAEVEQAARDSVRAIMMIRAYRMRGHLHADLDPLKLKAPEPAPELDPKSYGFTEADYGRKIFIDHVLGLEFDNIP